MSDIGSLERQTIETPWHSVWVKGGPVFSKLPDEAVHALEGRAIASFGDAATLGLWAFATGLLLTGLFQLGILPLQQLTVLFPVLIVYSGPVLFIAGLLLYRRNDTFLGSTFCSFGAFNLTRGLLVLCMSLGLSSTVGSEVQGVMMAVFAYIALSLAIGATRNNIVSVLMLACTFIGFLLSAPPYLADALGHPMWQQLGALGSGCPTYPGFSTSLATPDAGALAHPGWRLLAQIGGGFLLAGCACGYYGGTALLVNTAWRRSVLPIGGQP